PVHPRLAVVLEAAVLGGAGIGLQRDFQPRREAQPRAGALHEAVDRRGGEQARRAAAEEHAVHGATPGQRQVVVEIGQQRIHIALERQRPARLVRIEVAVRTLAHAPGEVDVEGEGRGGEHGGGAGARLVVGRWSLVVGGGWLVVGGGAGGVSIRRLPTN